MLLLPKMYNLYCVPKTGRYKFVYIGAPGGLDISAGLEKIDK
jgi:hypothetical protein